MSLCNTCKHAGTDGICALFKRHLNASVCNDYEIHATIAEVEELREKYKLAVEQLEIERTSYQRLRTDFVNARNRLDEICDRMRRFDAIEEPMGEDLALLLSFIRDTSGARPKGSAVLMGCAIHQEAGEPLEQRIARLETELEKLRGDEEQQRFEQLSARIDYIFTRLGLR